MWAVETLATLVGAGFVFLCWLGLVLFLGEYVSEDVFPPFENTDSDFERHFARGFIIFTIGALVMTVVVLMVMWVNAKIDKLYKEYQEATRHPLEEVLLKT